MGLSLAWKPSNFHLGKPLSFSKPFSSVFFAFRVEKRRMASMMEESGSTDRDFWRIEPTEVRDGRGSHLPGEWPLHASGPQRISQDFEGDVWGGCSLWGFGGMLEDSLKSEHVSWENGHRSTGSSWQRFPSHQGACPFAKPKAKARANGVTKWGLLMPILWPHRWQWLLLRLELSSLSWLSGLLCFTLFYAL